MTPRFKVALLGIVVAITLYVVMSFLEKAYDIYMTSYKNKKETKKRCQHMYDLIRNTHTEMIPFLETLEELYNMSVRESGMSAQSLETLMMNYAFYHTVFNDAIVGNPVTINEMIRFSCIHIEYVSWVKNYNAMKGERVTAVNFPAISMN